MFNKKMSNQHLYTVGLTNGSHKIVKVICDGQISPNCKKILNMPYKNFYRYSLQNNGKYYCLQCSRKLKHSGRNNPNTKYNIDDNFFSIIDSDEKAYILGWIASDGHIPKSGFQIQIKSRDKNILIKIKNIICAELPIRNNSRGFVTLTVNSQKISQDLHQLLGLDYYSKSHAKSRLVQFPQLEKQYFWPFVRGLYDGDGSIRDLVKSRSKKKLRNRPDCSIASISTNMIKTISTNCSITHTLGNGQIRFYDNNALDFLGKLYDNDQSLCLERKKNIYMDWCNYVPFLNRGTGIRGSMINFKWYKTDQNAIKPYKERVSDSGFDLTIIKLLKISGKTTYFDTCIKIIPEFGWYVDIIPRSSLSKTGYILANSIGVIDRTYVGNIIVALTKIDDSKPDITLPYRAVQMIPRPIVHVNMEQVYEIEETDRGDGAFGSTG